MAGTHSYSNFTVAVYERLISRALQRYQFVAFPQALELPLSEGSPLPLLLRHDIDVSVHRGLRLAQIERAMGVPSTFFLLFHSSFYNLLEPEVSRKIEEILKLGHRLGLHFDLAYYNDIINLSQLEQRISDEAEFLFRIFGHKVEAVSFHNPEVGNALAYDQDLLAGLVNTYSGKLRRRYDYISDSNGHWRFRDLSEIFDSATSRPLHLLVHPEWWVEEALSPRHRISRAIEGRAKNVSDWFSPKRARPLSNELVPH